jgi:hypothetical protein
MSEDPKRIDPITAEHLLRGARSGSPDEPEPLADLLAAAAAPARPGELAGEEAAVAAFREARLAPAHRRRRFLLRSVLVKASVVSAVAVVGGGGVGVALAAGTGHLPGTGRSHDQAATHAASTTAHAHASRQGGSRPAVTSTHGTRVSTSHDARPGGSPSPNLRGLCAAFTAHQGDNPGKALDDPAFKVLVKTAGGKKKVAAYCRTLLASPPSGRASTHPGEPPKHSKSDPPQSRPTDRQPGPPTTISHIP